MGYISSAKGQVAGVIPDAAEDPSVHTDLLAILNVVEKKLVQRFADASARDIAWPTPEEGMVAVLTTPDEIWAYVAGAWKKLYPIIYSGTADPNNAVGVDGDLFVKYV